MHRDRTSHAMLGKYSAERVLVTLRNDYDRHAEGDYRDPRTKVRNHDLNRESSGANYSYFRFKGCNVTGPRR
jgi:hypothetical protein